MIDLDPETVARLVLLAGQAVLVLRSWWVVVAPQSKAQPTKVLSSNRKAKHNRKAR
jgi:hypothetical protein